MITIDFETRSAVEIKNAGGWVYSRSPTTEPICLCYALGEDDDPEVWVPEWVSEITGISPIIPQELFDAIAAGALVEAHNAFFEQSIWKNIMVPRFGWPEVPAEQWRCSAAKASACALPRGLDGATSALGLSAKKDMAGHRIMLKLCKPRKARKAEAKQFTEAGLKERKDKGWESSRVNNVRYLWHESPGDMLANIQYCQQDVRAERELSQKLPDLSKAEQQVWFVDQQINMRGIRVDTKMAKAAIEISDIVTKQALDKAKEASGNAFKTLGQLERIKKWCASQGVVLDNMQAATVKAALAGDLPDNVRTVLESKKICSKTSIQKYKKLLMTADTDERIRDVHMYHGASPGRWTGRHMQTQNLVRGKMKDPDTMCALILAGDPELLDLFYGPAHPTSVLSWATRGAICAPPGRDLICADYSGVEARGLLWLVDDQEHLPIFRRAKGEPGIYRETAGIIYSVDPASIDRKTVAGEEKRNMGKRATLGLGYGMGHKKFVSDCARYNIDIDLDFSKHVVKTYRTDFHLVPAGWRALENAAKAAVRRPGVPQDALKVRYLVRNKFLLCRLPSGRIISYYDPKLKDEMTPWGDPTQKLTYMSIDSMTRKWVRTDTYGGKLIENVVQALCRDLLAAALVRIETGDNPYDAVMHVHDEVAAEVDEDKGSVAEFEQLISILPPWANGFPLQAEGWRGKRYRK